MRQLGLENLEKEEEERKQKNEKLEKLYKDAGIQSSKKLDSNQKGLLGHLARDYRPGDAVFIKNGAKFYVGDIQAAKNKDWLMKNNVTHIVNCVMNGENKYEFDEKYKYLSFDIC